MTRLQRPSLHQATHQKGVALAEFALILPILVLLVVAIIDFGRAVNQSLILESAARAGAEYAALFPEMTTAIEAVIAQTAGSAAQPQVIEVKFYCLLAGAVTRENEPNAGFDFELCNEFEETWVRVYLQRSFLPSFAYPVPLDAFNMRGEAEFRLR